MKNQAFTLAEILRAQGYSTRAYVANSLVGRAYRFHRGFSAFDASVLRGGHPGERETSRGLSERVIGDADGIVEPFFVWVHYMDPHREFLRHEGFDLGETETHLYDGEIAHTDAQIGEVLAALDERGLLDWTVVILTADHGEELGEHGGTGHFTLHEEVLRIPLIIRSPTLDPAVVEGPVSQIDVLPTLSGLLGLEPKPGWRGADVLGDFDTERPLFFERHHPGTLRQRSVLRRGYKLILIDENPGPRSKIEDAKYDALAKVEPGLWLYDLSTDPGETRNLADALDSETAEMLALLDAHFGDVDVPEGTIEMTPERQAELRSLGYIQ